MSAATDSPQEQTARIVEVSSRQTVTWTMPRRTYEIVSRVLKTWPFVYGKRGATVERILAIVQMAQPDVMEAITRTVEPAKKPAIRGHKGNVFIENTGSTGNGPKDRRTGGPIVIHDEPFTTEQIAALDPGKVTKP